MQLLNLITVWSLPQVPMPSAPSEVSPSLSLCKGSRIHLLCASRLKAVGKPHSLASLSLAPQRR